MSNPNDPCTSDPPGTGWVPLVIAPPPRAPHSASEAAAAADQSEAQKLPPQDQSQTTTTSENHTQNQNQNQLDADADADADADSNPPPSLLPPPTELVHLSSEPDLFCRVRTGTPTDEQLILLAAEAQKKHEEGLPAEQHLTAWQKQQKAQELKKKIQAKLPFQYLNQKRTNEGRLLGLMLWRYGMFNFFMEEVEERPEWKVSAPGKLDEDDKVWCCMALTEKVAAALSTPMQTAKEPYQHCGY
ncbi:hypothetical protein B0H65DRAFT_445362 [Neurospora tetraspora]|uniref:Uncharacterized protein n=1 Tax=Neurospora tetraspora TaxID=94610 RepID=A0AAE0JA51_9PEZI|nr:hypothetical protein B0H65DRAFT_445362 [Neurospora tetraspora]